ncbi:MAG: prepilin-type N-terminal cleavage/methylation domain-containing protein [Deltaproteobacteria bacterium]|nr:prepilin-type N-terminal cleavage/methylation domain-containing protein [Deltaproteobacteria bacterium]
MRKAGRSGSEGFTLLEVVVAMVILAIALLGLAGLQVVSVQGNNLASQITDATTLAQDQLEQLIATPFSTLVGLGTVTNSVTKKGVVYSVQYTVIPDPGGSRADVTVAVSWRDERTSVAADNTHTVRVNSVISEFYGGGS